MPYHLLILYSLVLLYWSRYYVLVYNVLLQCYMSSNVVELSVGHIQSYVRILLLCYCSREVSFHVYRLIEHHQLPQ